MGIDVEFQGRFPIKFRASAHHSAANRKNIKYLKESGPQLAEGTGHLEVASILSPHPALIDEATIARRVDEMAGEIANVAGGEMVVVGLLKGCFVFMADLVRALHRQGVSCTVDFMRLSSYADAKVSSGSVKMAADVSLDLAGRQVLIVDDILDTGRTLAFARERLQAHRPAGLWTAALLDKPSRRELPFQADFVGFAIPDRFVAGYGIDHAERHRDIPYIVAID